MRSSPCSQGAPRWVGGLHLLTAHFHPKQKGGLEKSLQIPQEVISP